MADDTPARSMAQLGLWDAVSVIVGIVIGAGIYETVPFVFQNVPSGSVGMLVWALGGMVSLIGALTYAELASTYPRSGGDYVYLSRAYGRWLGFLFGWAQLAVILTGSIGMMAYVFADYSAKFWALDTHAAVWFAAGAVIALTALNMLGMALGKTAQNVLSAAKILGLSGVVIAGLTVTQPADAPRAVGQPAGVALAEAAPAEAGPAPARFELASLGLALVLVLVTYGGWNDAAFFVADLRNRRTIVPALLIGTGAITLIYLLINAAYLRGLGFEGVRQSSAIAADVLQRSVGNGGAQAISVLVMISALGSANGLIFAGSRVYSTLGADYRLFAWLGRWHPRSHTPLWSLGLQGAISVSMILMVGSAAGQHALNALFHSLGFDGVAWDGRRGFDTLLRCTAPVFWLFFLLTSVSLFVLRGKDPQLPRPFRVPGYPWLPLVFTTACAYMLYSGIQYAGTLGLIGLGLLLLGLPLYLVSRPQAVAEPEPLPPLTT